MTSTVLALTFAVLIGMYADSATVGAIAFGVFILFAYVFEGVFTR